MDRLNAIYGKWSVFTCKLAVADIEIPAFLAIRSFVKPNDLLTSPAHNLSVSAAN
jgi:hypothetical protein